MKKIIRVGSRCSRLALAQTGIIVSNLSSAYPETRFEIVEITASGDVNTKSSVDYLTAKGQFSDTLETALAAKEIDIAVHSLKDLPFDSAFPIYAYGKRADPRDVLVLPSNTASTPLSARDWPPVGFSCERRKLQMIGMFPKITIKTVRGNVLTRLEKLDGGEYGSLVLAAAGLLRLGLQRRISRFFSVEEIVPAAGQGILAVQGRPDEDYSYLAAADDADARRAALLERALMGEFGGGCVSPHAAYAEFLGGGGSVHLMYSKDGKIAKGAVTDTADKLFETAKRLAGALREESWKE
jgi:hydroxymethylbilane synthase